MGLLDAMDDPTFRLGMGLLGAGSARSDGAGLGQRLNEVVGGMDQWAQQKAAQKRQALQEQMYAMQMQEMQQKQAQEKALRDAATGAMVSPEMANAASMGPQIPGKFEMPQVKPGFSNEQYINNLYSAGAPEKAIAWQQAIQKDDAPVKLGAGEVLLSGKASGYKPLFSQPKEIAKPADEQGYELAKSQGYKGTFFDYQIDLKRAGSTKVTVPVNMQGDSEYSKNQGKSYSDLMESINKSAFTAPSQLRKLERMTQLLEGVDGGKLAPMGTEVASALNSFGIKIDPKLGNKEASLALSREMAGGLRQPGTGPMTDKDFDNFLLQIPDLSKSASGRKQITETMRRALSRDVEVAKRAREYEKRVGRIDGGFIDEVSRYIAENPVIALPEGYGVRR